MRTTLKNILEINKNDFKSVFSNPIVVITLIGIIVLPSLYAVLNIQACWDPYGNTGDLDFAIANIDNGSTIDGVDVNVGNEVVDELKNNDDFNWKFVSEEELRTGVEDGTYYAGIVIPKNFSENIGSIMTNNPHSAELEYVHNEKTNPVASKLSDSGAKAVYNKINAKVVQIINLAALDKLSELQSGLSQGAGQLSSGAVKIQSGASQVSSGSSKVSSGVDNVKSGASKVKSGASEVSSGSSKISSGASQVSKGSQDVSSSADKISQGAGQVESGAAQLDSIDTSQIPSAEVQTVVQGSKSLANSSSSLARSSSSLAQGSSKLANSSVGLAQGADALAKGSSKVANGSTQLADGSVELANGALSLAAGSQLLADNSAYALYAAASSLSLASSSLSDVTGVDDDKIGDYIYSPVKLNENELNPISNYGSEVSPFYIVLSIWVGALISCVMLKPGYASNTKYTPTELYFGKLALFLVVSILQATVTIIGCFLLGIDVDNPLMFIVSTYIISIVFMVIIYSIIASLGDVGKAITIIFLVLQISGTGGIYPIQLMHPFFQTLYPYLPMTYGIMMLRESLLGMIWSNYLPAMASLIVYGVVFLLIAVAVKIRFDKRTHYFEERLNDSGLF